MTGPEGTDDRHDGPAGAPVTVPDPVAELLRTPFDTVLVDPARLRLQAALHGLPAGASATFTVLRRTLGFSDGNLGAHLAVLVDAGYVTTEETWRGKRRTSRYRATDSGRAGFAAHVEALRSVIGAGGWGHGSTDGEATGPG